MESSIAATAKCSRRTRLAAVLWLAFASTSCLVRLRTKRVQITRFLLANVSPSGIASTSSHVETGHGLSKRDTQCGLSAQ